MKNYINKFQREAADYGSALDTKQEEPKSELTPMFFKNEIYTNGEILVVCKQSNRNGELFIGTKLCSFDTLSVENSYVKKSFKHWKEAVREPFPNTASLNDFITKLQNLIDENRR